MRRRLRHALPLVLLAALTMVACETDTPIEPEEPELTTVPFSGTLTVNGSVTHRFTTQGSGDINVTLKTLTPSTAGVGLGLGVWTGASCNLTIVEANALPNSKLIGNATASGEFCTRIADDLGRLTGPVTYDIEVTHF
jgi:hypothetical protein